MAGRLLSVYEAADRLDVSARRIRQRIQDGSLPAERIGNQWGIDPALLEGADPLRSRPMSKRMAWALIDLLAGHNPDVSPAERLRLKNRAAVLRKSQDPASLLRSWAASRAERHKYSAASADLDDLRGDDRLHLSGLSADDSGLVARNIVEAYIDVKLLADVVDDYFLVEPEDHRGNVVFHVYAVDDPDHDAEQQEQQDQQHQQDEEDEHDDGEERQPSHFAISWPLIAIDLAEHGGSRARQQAAALIRDRLTG